MYLLDSNILLEILLEQEKAEDVERFLRTVQSEDSLLTDFALHSIGIILINQTKYILLNQLINDLSYSDGIKVIGLDINDFESIISISQKFRIDFDDAYQYVSAEKYQLTLISFDSDFDRTPRGRKTPSEILNSLKNLEQKD